MSSLLLSPHNDDECLFGSYTILRERPHVIVCFASLAQSFTDSTITAARRTLETRRALDILDPYVKFEQWDIPDWPKRDDGTDPRAHSNRLRAQMGQLARDRQYDRVFAPLPEPEGDPQHNLVGETARALWGDRVTFYCTYQLHHGKTTSSNKVLYHPEWPARKRLALACYESQLSLPSTVHHFTGDLDEFYAD
jgi:LmbE family N-acetylglucosaminyl deacetylase